MADFPVEDTDEMLAASAYGEVPFGPTPINFSLPQPPASVVAPPAVAPPPIQAPQGRQINPGNWVYAGSRMPSEAPVQFPDQPPDVQTGYGIQRFDLPGGVAAYHVSQDYQERQRQLDQQAAAAREARDQAVRDAQMLDQMARVTRSVKDIELARQQIDMQGLQRELNALGPNAPPAAQAQVIARHPISASHLGAGYAAALKAQVPAGQTSYVAPTGGAPGYVVDARGVPHFPPNTENPTWVPATADIPGHYVTRGGAIHFPPQPIKEGSLNDRQKAELREIDRQAHDLRLSLPTNPNSQAYIDGQQALGELDLKRRKILNAAGGATPRAAVVAPTRTAPVAVLGQGTREDPARPETPEQMASIPSGAIYRNPADGKLYRKK